MNPACRSILTAAFCLGSLAASAAPLKWTLHDVTSLGSSITGSFVYDADTKTYSDIDIRTESGSVIPGTSWTNAAATAMFWNYDSFFLQLVDTSGGDQSGANTLALMLSANMTNAGTTTSLYATYQGTCNTATCGSLTIYPDDHTTGFNTNVTGYLVASAVPEPTSLSVLAAGAGAIFLTRKRRTRLAAAA